MRIFGVAYDQVTQEFEKVSMDIIFDRMEKNMTDEGLNPIKKWRSIFEEKLRKLQLNG